MTDGMANPGAESATERLVEQGKTVREDMKELGDLAREAAAEKLAEARRYADGYMQDRKERVGEVEDKLVTAIREKPIQSVLIAAGAGALFGMLFLRR